MADYYNTRTMSHHTHRLLSDGTSHQGGNGGGNTTPSVMTNSLASTLTTNFFGGATTNGTSSSSHRKKAQTEAATISRATATAISAARSILLTGGSHSSAISTARAAAYSILSPNEQKQGFLTRRKNKQQAQVIANMAVVTVSNANTPNDYATVSDPTVVFMEQQQQLSKGNTTASTTDDLSWQKNFTRSTAESQPEQQQQHGRLVDPVKSFVAEPQNHDDDEDNFGDASFITCETPTSCNVSHASSATALGYFRNKQQRGGKHQIGRKMQLDIIESSDDKESYDESCDDSSYSSTLGGSTLDGSEGAETQDFTTATTDYTDGTDEQDDDDDDEEEEEAGQQTNKGADDADTDDDDDDVVTPGRRAMVPAQLQTSNLFEDQIFATLTDLCTPSNANAMSPPSSQRCGSPRTFAFEARDDLDEGELSDNTDSNGSSILGSYFLTNELNESHSLDAGRVKSINNNTDTNKSISNASKQQQDGGIEQVVLRALASSILPRAGGKTTQVDDEALKSVESQSTPSSPNQHFITLPGTYIRNDPISKQQQQDMFPKTQQRQRSYSESRIEVTASNASPRMANRLSPLFRNKPEPSPATTAKKSNTTSWFRWKKRSRKVEF